MVPKLLAMIHFGRISIPGYSTEYTKSISLWSLVKNGQIKILFCANPSTSDIFKIFIAKAFFRRNTRVVLFDLILRRPDGLKSSVFAFLKRIALKAVDLIVCIHKDTTGYQKWYGLSPEKLCYVPFKANNLDLIDQVSTIDGDYIISCGASHRDFETLLKAIGPLGYKTKIILSDASARLHNALLGDGSLPDFVQRLKNVPGRNDFYELIARSRLVVIPILPGTIQPAGVSVYLEAMALGKPVVITKGSSTENLLDETLAVLVPPGDELAMREAIHSLWVDVERRKALSQAGQEYAFSLQGNERMIRDIEREIVRNFA